MLPYANSKMDMLRAQALAMRLGQTPHNPQQMQPMNLMANIGNQPIQSMLRPKYTSNMGGSGNSLKGYSYGRGF